MKKFLAIFTLGLLLVAHFVEALPPTPPYSLPDQTGNSGKFLTTDGTVESWAAAAGSTSVVAANEATDSSCFPLFVTAATGTLGPKTNTGLTFDSSTGALTASKLSGIFNGSVGTVTPSTGDFTTLSASSTVSGTGFSTYLASPPAIGGTAAAAVQFKKTIVSHSATEAANATAMYGDTHLVTGAYTVTLPTAVAGMHAKFCATTAAIFSIDLQATDYWILNGTTLTQANKVSSSGFAGECIEFTATATNYFRSTATSGTFIDGGA